ncbi:MAG: hypothetical protein ACK4GT_03405 [Pararhodobacter sp.]
MKTIKPKAPLSVKEVDRLSVLAVDVADHSRIAGLEFAAMLEDTIAESNALEAARRHYLHGEASTAEVGHLKAAAKATGRRADAYAAEAAKARDAVDEVLDEGTRKQPFRLDVSVSDAERQPLSGIEVHLNRGKAELGMAMTDEKGMAEFRLAAEALKKGEEAQMQSQAVQRSIRRDVAIDVETGRTVRLTAIALHVRGYEIGRGGTDAVLEPGGSARIDIQGS